MASYLNWQLPLYLAQSVASPSRSTRLQITPIPVRIQDSISICFLPVYRRWISVSGPPKPSEMPNRAALLLAPSPEVGPNEINCRQINQGVLIIVKKFVVSSFRPGGVMGI